MATFRTKSANAALFIILCVLIFQEASDATMLDFHGRKVLSIPKRFLAQLKEKKILKSSSDMVSWELRTAPSGPDPLHHNGGSPKKPRTP